MSSTRILASFAWLILVSSASTPASAQTVIKLGTIAPEQSVWHDALLRIRQQWREISGGDVELRIYAGGVLGGEDEMIRKMQRRGLDAIAISGAGLPLIDDIVGCLDVPLLFDSYAQLLRVRDAVSDEIEASIENRGYKILGWAEAGWVRFFAKAPVRLPDDLKRQRLWISTGAPEHEQLLNQFGFRVVALPVTDMLTGLQTGLIDAIDVPPLFALVDRSYREAPYMTDLPFAPLNSAIVINKQIWERVAAEYRADFLSAVGSAIETLRAEIQTAEREAIDEMVARGLNVVALDAAATAEWEALAQSSYPELRCNRDHPELFQRVLSLSSQGTAQAP
jgi:TRAP-type C4-dicarboxylate transport system substrate-binding protein